MVNRFEPGTGRDEEGNPVLYERLNYQSSMLYSVEVREIIEKIIRFARSHDQKIVHGIDLDYILLNEQSARGVFQDSLSLERGIEFSNEIISIFKMAEKLAKGREHNEVRLEDFIYAAKLTSI